MNFKLHYKAAVFAVIFIFGAMQASGRDSTTVRKALEIGAGGALINLQRNVISDFDILQDGSYFYTVDDKHLYGGINLYAAGELLPWAYWDVQGAFGMTSHKNGNEGGKGVSMDIGPGLQLRPFVNSKWIEPYLRIGVSVFHKNFKTKYYGSFKGDSSGEAKWMAEDLWNKGKTKDFDTSVPFSIGAGVIGWISNKWGISLQGDFKTPLGKSGRRFSEINFGVVRRFGGSEKNPPFRKEVVEKRVEIPVDRIVEKVVEKRVEVPVEKVTMLSELMENITFEFNKSSLDKESESVLDSVARVLKGFPKDKFLVSGYTDSRGSDSYNQKLSEERARTVCDALVARGVDPNMITWVGYGKRNALIPAEEDDAPRKGDRKVVIERVTSVAWWEYITKRR